jgi:hypothetical protein
MFANFHYCLLCFPRSVRLFHITDSFDPYLTAAHTDTTAFNSDPFPYATKPVRPFSSRRPFSNKGFIFGFLSFLFLSLEALPSS